MLVRTPGGELGEIVEYLLAIAVKDVRSILVDEHTRIVVMVEGIPADVGTLIDDEHAPAKLAGKTLRDDTAGKPGADDQVVEHGVARFSVSQVEADGRVRRLNMRRRDVISRIHRFGARR